MVEAWPFIASSTELSTISQTRWCSPVDPTPPMYMPGRLRTGSSPSRTVMSFAEYDEDIAGDGTTSLRLSERTCYPPPQSPRERERSTHGALNGKSSAG